MKRFLGLPWAMVAVAAALLAVFGVPQLGGGPSSASAASTSQQIGMKVLLITDNTQQQRVDMQGLGEHAQP